MRLKGDYHGPAECPCFVPYLLVFLYTSLFCCTKMCLAMFFFKLVASTNYSPDDQNKTMPGPDKEVKKQKKQLLVLL